MGKNIAILDLAKRPAEVTHINTRMEKHGDSSVLAADIRIGGVHLEPDELNALLADKSAHAALFITANGKGKAAEPMFRQFKSFELVDKFADCSASIGLGLTDIAKLLEHLQSPGSVSLLFGSKAIPEGKKSQKDLDLGVTATKPADSVPAEAGVH